MKKLISKLTLVILSIAIWNPSANADEIFNYDEINADVAKEYLRPVRPGYEKKNPYWNAFSKKFLYAPAFDFKEIDGASNYRYTVTPVRDDMNRTWSFNAKKPNISLAEIWESVPSGNVTLRVEALDSNGNVIGVAGERNFLRDIPFSGPYREPLRDYREAARMALIYVNGMVEIQNWLKGPEPDMGYSLNTYPCKIVSATIRCELLLSKLLPAYKDEATKIARNAAQFLIDKSQPETSPLAYWPPTYYKGLMTSNNPENKNATMAMEAVSAGQAFLDMFDATGDSIYMKHALGIADTYLKLQNADGSWPVKVAYATGEPVNDSKAMLHPVLTYFRRLKTDYCIDKYTKAQKMGEVWMNDVALKNFDMTGQFEDVSVMNLQPYENLTNCTAAPYAVYLLSDGNPSKKAFKDALDLIRFSEDQFTFWDSPYNDDGIKDKCTPCVYEQFKFQVPVDGSACNVADALLNLYLVTGDKKYLAKSKALVDNITFVQNPVNGQIPTLWDFRTKRNDKYRQFWINCLYVSVDMLLKMADTMDAIAGK